MDGIWTYIKGIKTIHKVVVLLFCVSLIFTVNQQIVKYDDQTKVFSDISHGICERENPNNPKLIQSCVEKEKSSRDRERPNYILETSLVFFIFYLIIFPIYVILYHIFCFIYSGYNSNFKFSEMNFGNKLVHSAIFVYTGLLFLISYLYVDYLNVLSKFPVTPPQKYVYMFDNNNLNVQGVWVKEISHLRELKIDDFDSSINSVKIECNKSDMKCEHLGFYIGLDSNHFTGFLGPNYSDIRVWNEDQIVSYISRECQDERFTFDPVNDVVRWDYIKKDGKGCVPDDYSKSYTLRGGVEVHSELVWNERSRIIKMIGSLFN